MKSENKRFVSSTKYYDEYSTSDISYIYLPLSCESLSLQQNYRYKHFQQFYSSLWLQLIRKIDFYAMRLLNDKINLIVCGKNFRFCGSTFNC